MGTLSSSLAGHAERVSGRPRIYVDANMPAGVVGYMRVTLRWDVLFVVEHDDLRRARDRDHFRMARQLRRTLITLDRDYLDDRKFPPGESGGVLVLTSPTQNGLIALVRRLDRDVFRASDSSEPAPLPLAGQKLHLHAGES
jgi:predicted nuclease of predicted toxin-antitoxin system